MMPDDPYVHDESPNLVDRPILLELAVDDEGTPTDNSSWIGIIVGLAFSILFHGWLLFTLSGLSFEFHPVSDWEPIETVITDPPDTEIPLEVPEVAKYELANPGDRETEVGKALNARSVGMEFSNDPARETAPVHTVDMEFSRNQKLPHYDIPQGRDLLGLS